MPSFWFAMTVDRVPESFEDGIVLAEDMDEDGDIAPEDLEYAILARACCPTAAEAQRLISDAVSGLGRASLFLIADHPRQVVRRERIVCSRMEEGEVTLRTTFLAFKRGSPGARASALRILVSAVRRRWWQLWK